MRVWHKYGHDATDETHQNYVESDWTEWRDLGDELHAIFPDKVHSAEVSNAQIKAMIDA